MSAWVKSVCVSVSQNSLNLWPYSATLFLLIFFSQISRTYTPAYDKYPIRKWLIFSSKRKENTLLLILLRASSFVSQKCVSLFSHFKKQKQPPENQHDQVRTLCVCVCVCVCKCVCCICESLDNNTRVGIGVNCLLLLLGVEKETEREIYQLYRLCVKTTPPFRTMKEGTRHSSLLCL